MKSFKDHSYRWDIYSRIFTNNEVHNSTFQSQLNIGWFNLLSSMIFTDFFAIQQNYLLDIESKKYCTRWTTILIHTIWNITHQLWLHRNKSIHNTKAIHALSILIFLNIFITTEYDLGLDELPSIYSSYFHAPLPILLSKSSQYFKI